MAHVRIQEPRFYRNSESVTAGINAGCDKSLGPVFSRCPRLYRAIGGRIIPDLARVHASL